MAYKSSIVYVGKVALGGNNFVRVQSMTTTNTLDTKATVKQIALLEKAGCDIVRITTQNIKEAQNLKHIKSNLLSIGISIPLVADVHFNPKVAEVAAQFAEKIRINPGNYINNNKVFTSVSLDNDADERNQMERNLVPLLHICKEFGTAIRIGVNHGSLSNRILYKYGNTALGMVESIMEFVIVCHKSNFHNLVLSLKASSVSTMVSANMLLVKRLESEGLNYPIHLGVTEAGGDDEGRMKSSAGIGYLLNKGIGDTIRVSLTEDPLAEVPVALKLVKLYGQRNINKNSKQVLIPVPKNQFVIKPPLVVTSVFSKNSDLSMDNVEALNMELARDDLFIIGKFSYDALQYDDLLIRATVDSSILFLDKVIDGIWIENDKVTPPDTIAKLSLNILQILGLRISSTEYIACPTCGRSSINVIEQLRRVKHKIPNLPGFKIAVMGCAVNGPGEMADAHYGFVGSGKGKVNIYKGSTIVKKNVPQETAADILIGLIADDNDH